ncbi:MAG TPA: alanine dehydrogenase [Sphingobacteriaceae bacterium]|nr:alanine dehydrogenase [Sphingobacteriaceae bacterium]
MLIGVPREKKPNENRVGLTPFGAAALVQAGHRVLVEKGAGERSGFPDAEYAAAGADIVADPAEVYGAELIVKVKEPQPEEFDLLRPGQIFFAYLHLAAQPEVTRLLQERQVSAVAYETVQLEDGTLPLLKPMSEVAGRMVPQIGARLLEQNAGGRGILLAGVPGVAPGKVVIMGGGIVGINAARIASGLGAQVTLFEVNLNRLTYLDNMFGRQIVTLMSNPMSIAEAVAQADLLVGAVLVPGARTPTLVTEEMVQNMKPGSVIIDVAIDQGGCIETCDRVTSHADPVYVKHGVLHYAVPNIPGAVPRTSTIALTNATLPYVMALAGKGVEAASHDDPALAKGVNCFRGYITHPGVAEAHGLPYQPLDGLLTPAR